MFSTARRLLHHGMDVLLPHACPGCAAYLPSGSGLAFCAACYGALPWWSPAQHLPPELPKALDTFQAPLCYAAPLRDVLLAFKFNDGTHLAPLLARLLYPMLPPNNPEVVLMPVPMHPARLRARTYNHAALLVQQLAGLSGIKADVLSLRRIRQGEAQHNLTRAARLKLPHNTFACEANAVQGKVVVLIDDIFTTGATLGACAAVLKKAGAATVHGRTIAYTLP